MLPCRHDRVQDVADIWAGETDVIQRATARTLKRLFAMDPGSEQLSKERPALTARAIELRRIDLLPPKWRQELVEGAIEDLRVVEMQLR